MNKSPGQKYQLWTHICSLFMLFFTATTHGLWYYTWEWFEEPSWGTFREHYPFMFAALGGGIPFLEYERWLSYWASLEGADQKTNFMWHVGLPVVVSFTSSVWLVYQFLWVKGGREKVNHLKGPVRLEGRKAILHARKSHALDLVDNTLSSPGISIHPRITICTQREQNNIGIFGTTGAGKSMTFKPIVQQSIKRGDYAIIYDEKGEYTSSFYQSDTTCLIAPWDSRSSTWNICEDIRTRQEAFLVAKCLVPDGDDREKVWIKGARLLLIGMILTLCNTRKAWGWADLCLLLKTDQDEMLELLKVNLPIAHTFIQKESRTTQGFYIHLIGELSWVEDLAIAWPKPVNNGFSVKKWITERSVKRVIIIQADPRFEALGAPLCNSIVSLITRNYLASEEDTGRCTWLFIDEFANLPRNPMIQKWLELARSRGARSVLCTQSISQIREIYGDKLTDVILNLLSNVISLRIGPGGNDADYISKIFGENIVERPSSFSSQTSWVRSKERLVEDFELTQIKPASSKGVEGFLFVPGWHAILNLIWPIFKSELNAKKHLPAAWLRENGINEPVMSHKSNRLHRRGK